MINYFNSDECGLNNKLYEKIKPKLNLPNNEQIVTSSPSYETKLIERIKYEIKRRK